MQIGDFNKALITSGVNQYELEYLDPEVVMHVQPNPGLLTAMFGGPTRDIFMDRHTFSYDEITENMVLPSGKRYDEFGSRIKSDKARRYTYKVGSNGLTWNVTPFDRARKLVPGSTERMPRDYWISQKVVKAQKSWDTFHEISFASLMTTDKNNVFGGPHPEYNYHEELVGSARGAAQNMDLAAVDGHFQRGRDLYDKMQEACQKADTNMGVPTIFCGKNYFDDRYEIEAQFSLGREIQNGLDLATVDAPRSNFGSSDGKFNYQWFDSQDGWRYIKYNPTFQGGVGPIIGAEEAYAVPVGSDALFRRIFAPAQTETFIDTAALAKYVWTNFNDRTGTFGAEECNVLYININPQLIFHLVSGN